jgi:hypothetical protein
LVLPWATRPSTLKGCVGTHPAGYIRNVPLPRVPLQQGNQSHQVDTIPDYYTSPCWPQSTHEDFTKIICIVIWFYRGTCSQTLHHELTWSAQTMAACPRQRSMAVPLLHIPLSTTIYIFYHKVGQNPWFTAWIHSKMLLRNPSPPFHPSSQPHIMMVACPPNCPTPLPMTTLPSPPCLPNIWNKF